MLLKIVTHELGHLIGSPHTHSCAWNGNNTAIDGCSNPRDEPPGFNNCDRPDPVLPPGEKGTIMSYCNHKGMPGINFNLGFGPQPGGRIRAKVMAASCLECLTPENITNQIITTNCTITGCEKLNFENVTITNGATVVIKAGEKIVLKPGFHAVAGTKVSISVGSAGAKSTPINLFTTNDEITIENPNFKTPSTNNTDIEQSYPAIKLFPNPNPGVFQLETNFPLLNIAHLKITNLLGISVYETQNLATNIIHLQNATNGLYFVVVILKDGNVLTQKMMVQK